MQLQPPRRRPSGPGLLSHSTHTIRLGNLYCVEQHGDATTGTACPATPFGPTASPVPPDPNNAWRRRLFAYDSLSRLRWASNPESGVITYSYDADGNLLQKFSPAPNQGGTINQGTATQPVSYCYDALHRVTKRDYQPHTYTPGACPITSPIVSYTYDVGTNAIGHLTSLTDQAGTAGYTYDNMGRIATETRMLYGANNAPISNTVSYTYNLDSSIQTLTYPSGSVVTYTPTGAGRMLSAVDSGNGINYATSATYGPDGAPTGFISGHSGTFAGITNAYSYNKRLQPVTMAATAPSQTVYSIGYDFHLGNGTTGADNGNVFGITNYKDANRNQTFTYDVLNRLTSAQNAGTDCNQTTSNSKTKYWGNGYSYDAWGNLLNKTITKCGAENLNVTALANNQLSGYGFDAAGNMTTDLTDNITLVFDQENRLTGANGYTYTYDADGNRVRKSNGNLAANGTLYWAMTPGVVAETDLAGTLKSEYVFFDGKRVARRDGVNGAGGVFYYFSDHLKTAAVITDSTGNIKSESDFTPWGSELSLTNGDSNHYKFTGKERDELPGESGLDYFGARYYSNGLGRFVTPDWAAKATAVPYAEFADPQSLNLYSYVRNIPTTKWDVDGHYPCDGKENCSGRIEVTANKDGSRSVTSTEHTTNLHTNKDGSVTGTITNRVSTTKIDKEGNIVSGKSKTETTPVKVVGTMKDGTQVLEQTSPTMVDNKSFKGAAAIKNFVADIGNNAVGYQWSADPHTFMEEFAGNIAKDKSANGWRVMDIGLCAAEPGIGCVVAGVHAGVDLYTESQKK